MLNLGRVGPCIVYPPASWTVARRPPIDLLRGHAALANHREGGPCKFKGSPNADEIDHIWLTPGRTFAKSGRNRSKSVEVGPTCTNIGANSTDTYRPTLWPGVGRFRSMLRAGLGSMLTEFGPTSTTFVGQLRRNWAASVPISTPSWRGRPMAPSRLRGRVGRYLTAIAGDDSAVRCGPPRPPLRGPIGSTSAAAIGAIRFSVSIL